MIGHTHIPTPKPHNKVQQGPLISTEEEIVGQELPLESRTLPLYTGERKVIPLDQIITCRAAHCALSQASSFRHCPILDQPFAWELICAPPLRALLMD